MDLSKLTPAPWFNDGYRIHGPTDDADKRNGPVLTEYKYLDHGKEVDADFTVLARAAFDVMMTDGWWSAPHSTEPGQRWIALNAFGVRIERGGNTGTYFTGDDPFTPLVEAKRWSRKQVHT